MEPTLVEVTIPAVASKPVILNSTATHQLRKIETIQVSSHATHPPQVIVTTTPITSTNTAENLQVQTTKVIPPIIKITTPPLVALKKPPHFITITKPNVKVNTTATAAVTAVPVTVKPPSSAPVHIPKVSNVKVLKTLTLNPPGPGKKMEIPGELLLQSKLIQQFNNLPGISFSAPMLDIINEYCAATKELFNEKQKKYEDEIKVLKVNVDARDEYIKELTVSNKSKEKRLKEMDKKYKLLENIDEFDKETLVREAIEKYKADNDAVVAAGSVGEVLKSFRTLNDKFMHDFEVSLKLSLKSLESNVDKSEKGEDEKVVTEEIVGDLEETLGSLSQKLCDKIEESCIADRLEFAVDIENLFQKLCKLMDANLYDVSADLIQQLNPAELLNSDVNMGVVLQVPQIQLPQPPIASKAFVTNSCNYSGKGMKKSFLKETPKTGLVRVHDLYYYLQTCKQEINDLGEHRLHEEVMKNNLVEVKRYCVAMKLLSESVDCTTDDYQTPLHYAIINNASVDIFCTLLKYNAKVKLGDSEGNNIIHMGVESGNLSILLDPKVKELIGDNVLHDLANKTNNEGYAPLHIAAMNGKYTQVRELLELQADVDWPDTKSGRTAMFHACENNYVNIVELLRENHADLYVRNYAGTSIIDAISELDSDFSPEIKKVFYNDRVKAVASRSETEISIGPGTKRTRRNKKNSNDAKRKKS